MSFSSQPLPSFARSGLNDTPEIIQSVYRLVLQAEKNAKGNEERMNARVVGYFVKEFWSSRRRLGDAPVAQIAKEVTSTGRLDAKVEPRQQHQLIYNLGTRYRENLLRAFRSSKGPLPTTSKHPSRPSFDSIQQFLQETLKSSPKDYRTAKKYALARDGFKCMLSGKFDSMSVKTIPSVRSMMVDEGGVYEQTNCCHIFSESTTQSIDSTVDSAQKKRREYAATALAMLKSFGLETLVNKILDRGVHDPTNLLTLTVGWHTEFDSLDLWLEGTSTENEYDICVIDESWWNGYPNHPRRVLFTSRPFPIGNEMHTFSLPDPAILAIHATCARVAHMSGAAEYMNQCDRDLDDSTVLAADGSSAIFFDQLLRRVSLVSACA